MAEELTSEIKIEVKTEIKTEEPEKDTIFEDDTADDIPDEFFDDFSNNEFMDGLNVLDSWDEKVDPETSNKELKHEDKKVEKRNSRSKSNDRKRRLTRSRSANRSEIINRRADSPYRRGDSMRYGRYNRDRRSNSQERYRKRFRNSRSSSLSKRKHEKKSRERDHSNKDKEEKTELRRDINKTNLDIQRDKDRRQRFEEAKRVEKKVQVAESGLCPPGLEDMMDDIECADVFAVESRRKAELLEKSRIEVSASSRKDLDLKERRSRSADKFFKRGRRDLDYSFESRHRQRSRDRSYSPQFRRLHRRSRSRNSSESGRGWSKRNRISDSPERKSRKRSPFLHELARTLCKVGSSSNADKSYNQNFSMQYPSGTAPMTPFNPMQTFNPNMPPMNSTMPPMNPVMMQPPDAGFGFQPPQFQSPVFPIIPSSSQPPQSSFPIYPQQYVNSPTEPSMESRDENASLMNILSKLQQNSSATSSRSNLKDISLNKSSSTYSAGSDSQQLSKLFEAKKISLSDFLTVSAKGETDPGFNIQEKIRVISRCQDAVKELERSSKLSGRFIAQVCPKTPEVVDRSPQVRWKSPLKRTIAVKFEFTTKKNKDTAVQTSLKRLLICIGLLGQHPTIKTPPPPILNETNIPSKQPAYLTIASQTDPYKCHSCEIRKAKQFTCTAIQTKETITIDRAVQVSPGDLPPLPVPTPRGILKNSITHLTAAQLRESEFESNMKSMPIYNPFSGGMTNVTLNNTSWPQRPSDEIRSGMLPGHNKPRPFLNPNPSASVNQQRPAHPLAQFTLPIPSILQMPLIRPNVPNNNIQIRPSIHSNSPPQSTSGGGGHNFINKKKRNRNKGKNKGNRFQNVIMD